MKMLLHMEAKDNLLHEYMAADLGIINKTIYNIISVACHKRSYSLIAKVKEMMPLYTGVSK